MASTPKLARTGTVLLEQQATTLMRSPSAILTKYPSRLVKTSSVFAQKRDDTNVEEIKSNEWIDSFLTKDILFFIFTMLPRNDLAHASMVCKRWRSIAKDPYFGWVHIMTFEIRVQKTEDERNQNIEKDFGDPVDLKKRKTKITTQWNYTYETDAYYMLDRKGEEISVCEVNGKRVGASSYYGYYGAWEEFAQLCVNHPKLWRASWERIQVEDPYYFKNRFEVVVELNVKEFEDRVHQKQTVPGSEIIMRQIENENMEVSNKRLKAVTENKGENIPTKSLIPQKQPTGLRDGLNLYKYQLDAVAWMKSIEDDVNDEFDFKYCTLIPWRSAKTDILFDISARKFVTFDDISNHLSTFSPKGAVLADEMGLGKTIEFLGLILANPAGEEEEQEEEEAEEIEVDSKKKKNSKNNNNNKKTTKNTKSQKSSSVQRVRRAKRPGGQSKRIVNDKNASEDQKEFEKDLYDSTATLVLCPNHLAQQWESELVKNSNPPLKVHRFTTMRELGSCSYDDVANADVIIVSFQLLKNPNYFRIGHNESGPPRRGEQIDRYGWVRSQLKKVRKGAKACPIMEHFRWHRMVIDEGHEIVTDIFYKDTLALYTANHFWYVTGTPFPNSSTIQGILSYLEFPEHNYHQLWPLTDILITNLYWRNTRASVKEEYKIPPVVEELVVLDFTDIERTLYEEYEYQKNLHAQRQLCSQIPKIGMTPTLDGVRETSILNHKSSITNNTRSLKRARKELANLQTRLDSYRHNRLHLAAADKAQLERDIERYEENVKNYVEWIRHSEEFQKKFKQTIMYAERFLKTCQVLNVKAPARIQELLKQRKQQLEDAEKKLIENDKKYRQEHPEEFGSDDEDKNTADSDANKDNSNNNNNNNDNMSTDATSAASDQPADQPVAEQEETDDQPVLSETQILKLTVPQLKAELTARGLKPKGLKADLQAQLRVHFAGKTPTEKKEEEEKKSDEEEEEEEEKPKKGNKRTLRNRKVDTKEETKKGKGAKPKPKKRRKKDDSSESESDEEAEFSDDDKKSYDLSKKRSNIELLEELLDLIENYGTKMGNLIYYLRRLWEKTPEARVIIFSQFNSVLWEVSDILARNDIESSFVQGNVMSRNKAINSFRAKNSEVRVIMLGIEKAASGTNLVEASHVVLMDPVTGTKQEAQSIEAQAIARAHRQGQTNQVTLVRFVIQDTVEHSMYVKNYLDDDESQFRGKQKDLGSIHKAIAQINRPVLKKIASGVRPRMLKGASIGNLLANSPLKSSGAVIQLIENSADVIVGELTGISNDESKQENNENNENNQEVKQEEHQEPKQEDTKAMEE